jgi:hypothetical protein
MDAETRRVLEDALNTFRTLIEEGHKRITLEWTENGPIVCCTSMKPVVSTEVDLIITDEGAAMKWVPENNRSGVHTVPLAKKHPKRMEAALRRGRKSL